MFWLDWTLPTYMFYSAFPQSGSDFAKLYVFKKTIELGLSLMTLLSAMFVLLSRRSSQNIKNVACVALGLGIGFWLHRDLIYLLMH